MVTAQSVSRGAWRVRSVGTTHTGLVRPENEDSFVTRPRAGIWAVADGMGGHSRGEVASGMVRETLESLTPLGTLEENVRLLRERLEEVHQRLIAQTHSGTTGSTVASLILVGDRYACVWAGDSRVYRCRDGKLERLTRDHSLVEELVAIGALTPEAARHHPLSNRITRAVGVGNQVEFDDVEGTIAPGDRFLISSDGVHGVLEPDALAALVSQPDIVQAAEAVTRAVLAAGAPDNLTLILVAIEQEVAATMLRAPG